MYTSPKSTLARRTFLRGMGATVALPFLDAMMPAGSSIARERRRGADAHAPRRASRWCTAPPAATTIGAQAEPLVRRRRTGPRLRSVADSRSAARAVPRLPDDRQQHRRPQRRSVRRAGNRRRSLPVERGVPHAVASEADAGLRHLRRHLARSDLRADVRPGHADPVDAALHRERRSGRRLHLRLLVRLHRLDQLGVADRAAADDSRSARRVRSAVRRRRHAARSARERRAHAPAASSTGSAAR